ncbi:MAG: EAL domain-containing protein [Lysobacter sp.]|nr:EAL domain-containing protein [Lysobacter sp.]
MDRSPAAAGFRAQVQQAALFALLQRGVPTAGAGAAWRAITEAAGNTLEVARASIWLLSEDRTRLSLADAFLREEGRHEAGEVLESSRYPSYFKALRDNRTIVAPDAAADPGTREYAADYLGAHGIVSMLDAGIWQEGEARGVVCLETVGERREWTADEQQFAASLADIAATVLVHESLRTARASLQDTQELFAGALRSSPDPVAVVRLADSRILLVNARFIAVSGYAEDEVVGRTSVELGLWADPSQRDLWVRRLLEDGAVRDFEVAFIVKGGRRRTFVLSGERLEIRGEPCVVLAAHDVTDRRRQEALVSQIAQGVVEQTGEPFFRSLAGHLARVLGADLAFVGEIHPDDAGRIRTIAVHAGGGPAPDFEYPLAGSPCESILGRGVCAFADHVAELFPRDRALAEKGIHAYVGARLNDSKGSPLGLMAVLFRHPLEDAELAENLLRIFAARASGEMERGHDLRALEHLAHHDPLTGLPNRIRLRQCVESGLAEGGIAGALLLIDLDRFKEINDTLGHPVGDVLLRRVASTLREGADRFPHACVARLGGDEFAVWIPGAGDAQAAEQAARHVLASLTAPIDIEGYRLEIGASVGVALAPAHADTSSGLLRCADVAMYAAKRTGSSHAIYDASQDPYSTERLALLSDLGTAVRDGQLRVHYQPRVRLADGAVQGFEALVRWQHPRLGLLPPSRFVPLAELSDVIRPLTYWVLAESLHQQREWRDRGIDLRLAVNLSARHLIDEACASRIAEMVARTGVEPSSLELEITESAIIADPERAGATLERIRALGVRVAVDDFGTGFSSMSHLKRLPLTALKIDVSFVRQMLASPADRAIVESTIHLAHDLGLSVIAEGIEDEATMAALRAHGCDEGQGFFIGHPMTAADATAWLDERRA